ncbi:hypothetical protein ACIO6U_02965 [Streptomyces sp. NPDC087422]|uniref:hypothetical protein n=1 Tax=Streptomyces sp. NPDC087422 TaxID=3365786 RepID=UPI00380CA850
MRASLRRALAALTHSGPGYDLTPLPARGDAVETWLKGQRDEHCDQYGPDPDWYALDAVLNCYRFHADTRTPLDQPLNAEVPF